MDIMSPKDRSERMSRIRSRDTKPEMLVRSYLHKQGLRYRIHHPDLPGKPDIVLSSRRIVIFVNGCFWHGHDVCGGNKLPASNKNFWRAKIENNKARDSRNVEALKQLGYRVVTVWECELKRNNAHSTLLKLVHKIHSRRGHPLV